MWIICMGMIGYYSYQSDFQLYFSHLLIFVPQNAAA